MGSPVKQHTNKCSICHSTGHNKRTHGKQPQGKTPAPIQSAPPVASPSANTRTSTISAAAGRTNAILNQAAPAYPTPVAKKKIKLSDLAAEGRRQWLQDNPEKRNLASPFRHEPEALIHLSGHNNPVWCIGEENLTDGDCYFCGEGFYTCESPYCEYGEKPHLVHPTSECTNKMRNVTAQTCDNDTWDSYINDENDPNYYDDFS